MRPKTFVLFAIVLIVLGAVLASTAVAASPTAAACPRGPGTDASCPIRVQFAAGTYGTTVHGRLTLAPDQRYYVVRARAGQRMILSFVGAGAMRGGISFPDGSGDGPFNGEGDAITLPTTGDYIIYVGQNTMAGSIWTGRFSLSILIR